MTQECSGVKLVLDHIGNGYRLFRSFARDKWELVPMPWLNGQPISVDADIAREATETGLLGKLPKERSIMKAKPRGTVTKIGWSEYFTEEGEYWCFIQ